MKKIEAILFITLNALYLIEKTYASVTSCYFCEGCTNPCDGIIYTTKITCFGFDFCYVSA